MRLLSKKNHAGWYLSAFAVLSFIAFAGFSDIPAFNSAGEKFPADTTKKDTTRYTPLKDLPLKPTRHIDFSTSEGTWMSVDVSPDGQTIVFDLVGDIYTIPVSGGKATPVTTGIAFDTHPRYSPDGKKLLFTSDRSGSENVWILDMEKKDTAQLTKDRDQNFPNATWSPDGNYVIAARGKLDVKLWMYHKDGGGGVQLIENPGVKTIDPAVSADGRFVYYSQRAGFWNYNAQLPQYQVGMYDRENAKMSFITSRYGSAFTPAASKDGKWLVYGSRFEDKTGLILRNIETGDEKWLAYPVQRDDQESIATMGVLPGYSFTPDSKSVVASYGGKIYRIPIDGSKPVEIPFTADMKLELGPRLEFKYPISDSSHALTTQIRDAAPSPDGKKLAFTALNRLYVMDYPNGIPKRITANDYTEANPCWSPDGNSIVFVTWTPAGGHIFKAGLAGGKATVTQLTKSPALYSSPAWSYKNDRIVFIRSKLQRYQESIGPVADGGEDEICWIAGNGGTINIVERANGRGNPHFTKTEDRIYLNSFNGSLSSIRWDGSDEKIHAKLTGITTFGISNLKESHQKNRFAEKNYCMFTEADAAAMEVQTPSPAAQVNMSPEGSKAFALIHNDIYLVTIPKTGKTVNISLADPASSQFPSKKLTDLGGEFPYWESDGKKIHWSLGNWHSIYDIDAAQAFEDSVKLAKKEEEKKKLDSLAKAGKDTTKVKTDSLKLKSDSTSKKATAAKATKYKPVETQVKVYYEKDIPQDLVLLKGARIITMKGDEVIENGDVLIQNNRIKAVGKTGTLSAGNAKVIDASGKTIIPGFVDTHAHMWPQWGIAKNQVWVYAANLAYGVTTTRDPQTGTTDVLTYGDMVDAGKIVGPRIYSTGPGVGFWDYNIKDSANASNVLMQYSKYFNTKYIKMYLTGPRQVRQWIIKAAKDQKLMPTTEGGLNYKLNITNLLDGYPGHEHSIPIYPLYKDVYKAIADAKMCVTPTLLVSYGGPWAENYYYETEAPYNDAKLQFFTPYEELAQKSRRRGSWFMPEEHVFQKHAKSMNSMVENGALAGIGSHGQLQGLGYHWEVWSMQSGGMSTLNALKVATISGAIALGLDTDIGSIEAGKLADIIIMDKNPLENIRNTNSIKMVIKNGRIYDGQSLDEIYPRQRKLERSEWTFEKPVNNTGVKE